MQIHNLTSTPHALQPVLWDRFLWIDWPPYGIKRRDVWKAVGIMAAFLLGVSRVASTQKSVDSWSSCAGAEQAV